MVLSDKNEKKKMSGGDREECIVQYQSSKQSYIAMESYHGKSAVRKKFHTTDLRN